MKLLDPNSEYTSKLSVPSSTSVLGRVDAIVGLLLMASVSLADSMGQYFCIYSILSLGKSLTF